MIKWKSRIKEYSLDSESRVHIANIGFCRLLVHCDMDNPLNNKWLTSCVGFFKRKELKSKNLNEAKCQAVAILHTMLKDAVDKIEDV